jgi:hypothetical protein
MAATSASVRSLAASKKNLHHLVAKESFRDESRLLRETVNQKLSFERYVDRFADQVHGKAMVNDKYRSLPGG